MFYLLKNHDGGGANNVGYTKEMKVAANGTYKLGSILTAGGAIASGGVVGMYVCMEGGNNGKYLEANDPVLVTFITDGMVFEVEKPDADVAVGSSYQFNSTGTGIATTTSEGGAITATTATKGGVLVLSIDGDKVRVKINQ